MSRHGASDDCVPPQGMGRAVAEAWEQFTKISVHLSAATARKLLKGAGLVIDTFDNSASRRLVQTFCAENALACLHVGLFADYGEVIWNEQYRVPGDAAGDVCDYPLARNLVILTVAIASEILLRSLLEGDRENWSITLRDFAVRRLEAGA
ncbi:MAG: hypothetical protein ACM3U2_02130 [Deltaproteobacteria bacterium]